MKRYMTAAISITLLLVWCLNVVKISECYAESEDAAYNISETMKYNDLNIRVEKIEFLESEKLNKIYENAFGKLLEQECMLVYINIENNTTEEKRIELGSFVLQSGAYKNMVIMEVYQEVNQGYITNGKITTNPIIEAESSFKCILTYTIPKVQYTNKQWEKVREDKYQLVVTLYPVKRYFELN